MKSKIINLVAAFALFGSCACADIYPTHQFSTKERGCAVYLDWVAYGTFTINPYTNLDNPSTNLLGLPGEVTLPYTVPEGYDLVIDYLQIEGPDSPQVGMMLWLGDHPCQNSKAIISCTTAGGSTQLNGMTINIGSGQIVNIRVMNNTGLPWCNGFFLQGYLRKNYDYERE